jgi:hypothetical protein
MYFSTMNPQAHQERYEQLLERYGEQEPAYLAACYVVAYPGIIHRLPEGKTGSNPFSWYWGPFDPVLDRRGESAIMADWPEGIRQLARAGVELYAGRALHFELPAALQVWDEDQLEIFCQAIRLIQPAS